MAPREWLMMLHQEQGNGSPVSEPAATNLAAQAPGNDAEDLTALVAAARDGDHSAYEALITRFQTPVRAYLARLVDDEEQAHDLTQETLCQAWKALSRLREPTLFRVWLFRIATNRARSWLRHKRLIGWVSLDWLSSNTEEEHGQRASPAGPGDTFHTPASEFEERVIETETLRQAMSQVPVEYRSCLLLHLSLGFTVPEVAGQLGLTRGAVRMRLFRGLALLREAYHQQSE